MKQLLSLLLAICLMVTMVSVSAVSAGAASVDTQTSTGEVEQFPNSMYVDFTNVLDAPGSYWFAWTWDSNGNATWRTIEEFGYVEVYPYVLFVNCNTDTPDWENVKAQTEDITVRNGETLVVLNEKNDQDKFKYEWKSQPETQPETQPASQPASQPTGGTTPGYYVVGSMNDWRLNADYKMTAISDKELMLDNQSFAAGAQFKVVYSRDGSEKTGWFPDGNDNNYVVSESGTYTVYFRPNLDGGDDYYENCIKLVQGTAPEGSGYYVVGDMNNWTVDAGYKMTKASDSEYKLEDVALTANQGLKVVYSKDGLEKTGWFPDGNDNNYVVSESGTYTITFRPNKDGGEGYHYGYIKLEKGTAPEGSGYYVVGDMNNWTVNAAYKMTKVDSYNEYTLENQVLSATKKFKVVYSADGTNITAYYPSEEDSDYVVAKAGTYTIYFRPNGDGGADYHYGYIKIVGGGYAGHDVSLRYGVTTNFFYNLTETQAANAYVTFTWEALKGTKTATAGLVYDEAKDLWKASCDIAAAEMTSVVKAVLVVNGIPQAENSYSVKEYAAELSSNPQSTTQLKELVKAMLDYGARAQIYFNFKTDDLANGGNFDDGPITTYDVEDAPSFDTVGLEYTGTTVVYLNTTSIRHYFKITDQDKFSNCTVTFAGEEVQYTTKGDEIYFEKKGIPAAGFNARYALIVSGENKNVTYNFSVNDYIMKCMASVKVSDKTKDLVKAAYAYGEKALAYFNTTIY